MAYTRVNWEDLPSTNTPINATNLNKMDKGIKDNYDEIQTKATLEDIQDNLVNVSNEVDEDYRVNLLKGKNLFDEDNCSNITINSSGVIGANSEYLTTNYLPTKPNTKYYFSTTQKSGQTNKQIYIAYYDINKNFLSRETYAELEHLFTTPANCYYMRAGVYITGQENYQLEKGEEKTTYEPYITPSIYVDNEEIYNQNIMNYSTSEQRIGTWIDGKPLYRKVVNFGALPNTTTKTIQHQISNVDNIVNISGCAINNNHYTLPIPSAGTNTNYVLCQCDRTNLFIITGSDRSTYNGYVVLEYTKTTD